MEGRGEGRGERRGERRGEGTGEGGEGRHTIYQIAEQDHSRLRCIHEF